jgi:hypothetical protein
MAETAVPNGSLPDDRWEAKTISMQRSRMSYRHRLLELGQQTNYQRRIDFIDFNAEKD